MSLRLIQGRGWPSHHPVFGPRKVPAMPRPQLAPAGERRYLLGCLPVSPDWMLLPREAAVLAGVSAQTLRNWEQSGKLCDGDVEITKGGQRRYRAGAIIAVLEGKPQ